MPYVELREVHKRFGGVHALRGVDLAIERGEVLGLVGENGAGKSTLIKVMTGIYAPDEGEVLVDSVAHSRLTPVQARDLGIASVAQELSIFEHLSVAQNIVLGREPVTRGFISGAQRDEQARRVLDLVGCDVSSYAMVRDLSFADRQLVEIAKALVGDPRILILDEPTSALREGEVARLLALVRDLAAAGRGVILITHRMSELFEVCDTFVVLKDGHSVASVPAAEASSDGLVSLMVGRQLEALFPDKPTDHRSETDRPLLQVSDFSVPGSLVHDVSFTVYPGEILGIAGLAGHGQTQLLEGLAGIEKGTGSVQLGRHSGPFATPRAAQRAGISLVPEDRKNHGLVLPMTVLQNATLPTLANVAKAGFVNAEAEENAARTVVGRMNVRPPDLFQEAANLSGGNQQKVVLAKTLLAHPSVYLLSDPTRGIDVGTKFEIFSLIRELAGRGEGIVLVSTDLNEIVNLCDRVMVMSEGTIVHELGGDEITEETITAASFGRVS